MSAVHIGKRYISLTLLRFRLGRQWIGMPCLLLVLGLLLSLLWLQLLQDGNVRARIGHNGAVGEFPVPQSQGVVNDHAALLQEPKVQIDSYFAGNGRRHGEQPHHFFVAIGPR
jgi:hypothetical protein